jgi:thiamine biosynthesis lipoprotein
MELIEVLQLSHKFYDLSDGAFDVSCGNLYAFWKELIKKGKIKDFPSKEKIAQLKNTCGMENIEVNVPRGTVLIKKGGLKIDLGAIAIGYMVDRAVAKLKEKGIKNALINAGGDIYCLGNNRDRPWKVGIKDPKNDGSMVASENLIDRAITTSGNYEQFFEFPAAGRKNKRYSHLIDPHTGFPVENGILSVSVIADDCLSADSLATSFFVMGIEGIKKFIAKNNLEIKILVVSDNEKAESVFVFN